MASKVCVGRSGNGDNSEDAIVAIQSTYNGGLESASKVEMEGFEIYFGSRLKNIHVPTHLSFLSGCSTSTGRQVAPLTA